MNLHHLQPPSKVLVDTRKSLRTTQEILCTLGPASLDRRAFQRLGQSGATLIRKQMGCGHFIAGPDHTGVGNFYPRDADREQFESLGVIGVKPVCFETAGYNSKTDRKCYLWE